MHARHGRTLRARSGRKSAEGSGRNDLSSTLPGVVPATVVMSRWGSSTETRVRNPGMTARRSLGTSPILLVTAEDNI
eukprot:3179304-Amphidinium_carterae.1